MSGLLVLVGIRSLAYADTLGADGFRLRTLRESLSKLVISVVALMLLTSALLIAIITATLLIVSIVTLSVLRVVLSE